jgi:hypothetical protein
LSIFVIPGLSAAENPESRANAALYDPLDSGSRFARPE